MTKSIKIAKAVSLALAGAALTLGAASTASAHTMYNTFTTTNPTATDGWVYGGIGNPNYPTATPGFVGTSGTPFGYAGTSHLNWAAELHNVGDTLEISQADSVTRYGFAAEIDTGAGAWRDNSATPTGWRHQTDIGLIMAEEDMYVTLTPEVLPGGASLFVGNFGITVFDGMDTNTGSYSHHGSWNCPGCATPRPFNMDNPFGTIGLHYVKHDATVDLNNPITFFAKAGEVYSIYLGGAGVGRWSQNIANYKLGITTAPVPVPAAVWLFGSAMGAMGVFGRRDKSAA